MEGRCQCGSITFTTPLAKPIAVYICHCTQCQHQSSSAFGISAIFPDFDIAPPYKDAIGIYTRQGASGTVKDHYFCTNCGSRLMHKSSRYKEVSVKGGCLKGLNLNGAVHIWCQEALMDIPQGVERHEQSPPP